MKKFIYLSMIAVVAFMLSFNKASAQLHIVSHYAYDSCTRPTFIVYTDSTTGTAFVETSYGDGSADTGTIPAFSAYSITSHAYASNGTYTIKQVLFIGTTRMDSISYSLVHAGCGYIEGRLYHDVNSNCTFDAGDRYINSSTQLEVDSAGVPVDTIDAYRSFNYRVFNSGISFSFKVLSNAAGFTVACPTSGTVSATSALGSSVSAGDLGFDCPGGSGFDVALHTVVLHPGRHAYSAYVALTNSSCNAKSGTISFTVDSKYPITYTYPTGTISGNVVTWSYSGLTADSTMIFAVYGERGLLGWLTPGDTVVTNVNCPVLTGDGDTTNNSYTSVDTVTSSWDPNDKAVSPKGNIVAGTRLTYTLSFENTGNAPAENIHILDTLSANLDLKSMQVITSSSAVNVSLLKAGALNIVKFDFAGIHLLDSSHHGQCDGFVMFSIDSKNTLTPGTNIDNRAGIYFDANEVVMTNMVENSVRTLAVPVLNALSNVNIYPNPVNNVLVIKTNGSYENLNVINNMGQTVISQKMTGVETQVNMKNLVPGMYYIMIKSADGVKVEKIEKL